MVFPQDLLEKGLEADNFAMLGLGDIVIPGDGWGRGCSWRAGEVFSGTRMSIMEQTALPVEKGLVKDFILTNIVA